MLRAIGMPVIFGHHRVRSRDACAVPMGRPLAQRSDIGARLEVPRRRRRGEQVDQSVCRSGLLTPSEVGEMSIPRRPALHQYDVSSIIEIDGRLERLTSVEASRVRQYRREQPHRVIDQLRLEEKSAITTTDILASRGIAAQGTTRVVGAVQRVPDAAQCGRYRQRAARRRGHRVRLPAVQDAAAGDYSRRSRAPRRWAFGTPESGRQI